MKLSETLIKALTVAMELTGTERSDAAVKVMLADLSTFPEPMVQAALKRCARELKGRLTLADILQRIEDGRPAPQEAWGMVPKDERSSVVWTTEMRDAYMAAYPMVSAGDLIAARVTFIEKYTTELQRARDARRPVEWTHSPGTDKDARELVILDAVEKGRLSVEAAQVLLPYHRDDEGLNARLLGMAGSAVKRIEGPRP